MSFYVVENNNRTVFRTPFIKPHNEGPQGHVKFEQRRKSEPFMSETSTLSSI